MAQRRMFSLKIVNSDAFLDMPQSSQLLYFHLGMGADDDGFVSPKKIMRMIGSQDDDLRVLVAKRFVLPFENGVVVIKHWLINNLIRKDFYQETVYLEQKNTLKIKDNKAYTELSKQNVNILDTQVRLGKVSIGKDRLDKVREDNMAEQSSVDIVEIINSFKEVNPSYKKWFKNTTQRKAIKSLLEIMGKEDLIKAIKLLPKTNKKPYFPTITTPLQLEDKLASLKAAFDKYKNNEVELI